MVRVYPTNTVIIVFFDLHKKVLPVSVNTDRSFKVGSMAKGKISWYTSKNFYYVFIAWIC